MGELIDATVNHVHRHFQRAIFDPGGHAFSRIGIRLCIVKDYEALHFGAHCAKPDVVVRSTHGFLGVL